jgi:hypothetical protein
MRVSLISAVALLLVGSTAAPLGAQSVDEIVARHIEARGGYDKLKAIQTIKITKTVATEFNNIKVVVYKKRPQLYRSEQGPAGQPPIPRGVNAGAAWDTAPTGRVTLKPEKLAAETRETDADFDGLLVDWKAKGHTVTLEGTEAMTGGEAYKLKVTTKGGTVRYVYLDTKTYLDRRQAGTLNLAPNRAVSSVTDVGGWRDVDGVKFPFDLSEERTGGGLTQALATYPEKIELNVPMDDALFATPAGAAPAPGPGRGGF